MNNDKDETFIAHLEALRGVLIKCLTALALGLVPMFFAAPYLLDFLINLISGDTHLELNFFSPMEVFVLELKIALLADVLICFPYMTKKVWEFVVPALYERERKFIKSIVLSSSALFTIGVTAALVFILPMVIRFGLSFGGEAIRPVLGIGSVISLSLRLSFIFGIMFQFPLVTCALMRAGLVSYQTLAQRRRYIFIGILILSGVLTPPDIVSQIMLGFPTYGLFELGLWFGKRHKNVW